MFPLGTPPSVVVVGAGVTGLLAARRLSSGGARVTLLERSARPGGQIHTVELGGLPVDVGAEAVHLALPATTTVVDELALGRTVESSRPGTSWLWTGRRRALPAGVGPAGPTRIMPVLTSRVLGPAALVRAGLEPVAARRQGPIDLSPGHDISVGEFVTSRFGRAVCELFVDPLLGSLHSGNVDELSLRACAPSLAPAARAGRPLLRRPTSTPTARPGAAPGATPSVMFANWPGGLRTLTDAIIEGTDVEVRHGAHVTGLRRMPAAQAPGGGADGDGSSDAATAGRVTSPRRSRYELTLATGEVVRADGVVLAVPAAVAAELLTHAAPDAAATLARTPVASTATLVLGFRREDVEHLPALRGNGFLVPSRFDTLVKAGTHLSTKWSHLDDAKTVFVRASAGRAGSALLDSLDDVALLDHVRRDLRRFTGIEATPTLAHVQRWTTGLPQLTVGHPDRIASVRSSLESAIPGVEVAGASYDGIGIGACLASGEQAAARVAARFESLADPAHRTSTS